MSENETKQDESHEIVVSGKVPYLAILATLLRESKDDKTFFDIVDETMTNDEKWKEVYSILEDDASHKNITYFSFPKETNSLDLAVSCMVMSASNTFSNTKKDVVITPSTIYVTQLVLEQAWKSVGKDFGTNKTLTREDFKENMLALSNTDRAVIPVDEEIALLHGRFSRDTWKLLHSIVSPVDLPKSAYKTGDGKDEVYGYTFMVGDSYEALALLCDTEAKSWDEHVAEDFNKIILSFKKEKTSEEDNNVSGDKDQ